MIMRDTSKHIPREIADQNGHHKQAKRPTDKRQHIFQEWVSKHETSLGTERQGRVLGEAAGTT